MEPPAAPLSTITPATRRWLWTYILLLALSFVFLIYLETTSSSSFSILSPFGGGASTTKSSSSGLDLTCSGVRIPVVVAAHNNPTFVAALVQQLRSCLDAEVIVADMESTFPPMLEYLSHIEKFSSSQKEPSSPSSSSTSSSSSSSQSFDGMDFSKVRVVRLPNKGPHEIFRVNHTLFDQLPRYFAYTDGDLRLGSFIPRNTLCVLAHLTHRLQIPKAGLALDISDSERMWNLIYAGNVKIWQWEDNFFSSPVQDLTNRLNWPMIDGIIYSAPVDTTFAVYDKTKLPCDFRGDNVCFTYKGVRAAGVFATKHLPWYPEVYQSLLPGEVHAMFEGGGAMTNALKTSGIMGPAKGQWNETRYREELRPKLKHHESPLKRNCHLSAIEMEIPPEREISIMYR